MESNNLWGRTKSPAVKITLDEINACRDGFNLAWYRQGRDGFRKGRVHRVRGIPPTEIMDKIERTAGIRIPAV